MGDLAIGIEQMRVSALFQAGHSITWKYLEKLEWPWEALPMIGTYIDELAAALKKSEYDERPGNIWIHKSATVAPSAFIGENVIIGAYTEIRHCAFIRGNAIVGEKAVVGNSTELKNVILFDNVQVPHYNYVGDSVFGYKAHTGAGAVTCNVKNDHSLVVVKCGGEKIETGLKKFGAVLGDSVDIGCNSALNPGTVIGSGTSVYPLSRVRGFVPGGSIYKGQGDIVERV